MIALSFYFAWTSSNKKQKQIVTVVFAINLFFNLLWSILFFAMQNPKIAFFELILLEISIIFIIKKTYRIDKKSGYLLFPYALWVAFAGILNYMIAFQQFFKPIISS